MNARQQGKSWAQFQAFLALVKSGKKPVILSSKYVVMSRESYDQLMGSQVKYKVLTDESKFL